MPLNGSRIFRCLLLWLGAPFLVLAVQDAAAAERARGVVYHDINGTRTFDRGDRPVRGVAVSNGRDIVMTDGSGRYELSVTEQTSLFVIKPRGWRTAVDRNQIPQFFYIHSPKGAEGGKVGGLEPTGPLPASIDFPLYPQEEPEQFDVLVFGDTQPRNLEEVYYVAHDSVGELGGVGSAFGVTLGDIVFDNLSIFEDLNSAVATIGIPWRHVIGNHDADKKAPGDAGILGAYKRIYGPDYYSFEYGPAHFIALNNIQWEEKGKGRAYRTGLGADQLTFVRNELRRIPKDRLVVFMAHIPWVGSTPWADEGERDQFFALLGEFPKAISLVSHMHMHYHELLGKKHGWRENSPHHMVVVGAVCGSWWGGGLDEYGIPHSMMRCGTPTGYGFLSIDGAEWKFGYRAARRPAHFQMHLSAPNSVPAGAVETEIFANIFNALPDAQVMMRVGPVGNEWHPMKRTIRPDPVYAAVRAREDQVAGRPPPAELPSSRHLWRAILPAGLSPGFHVIDVRAKDRWAVYEGRRLIRIE